MPKIIYDIIGPKYRRRAKYFMVSKVEPFWQGNSGNIKLGGILLFTLSFFAAGLIFFIQAFPVSADVINLRPDGDQTAQWPNLGTNDSSCAGGTHCDQVDDNITQPTAGTTTDYVRTGTSGAGGEIEEYTMTTITGVGEVTSVKFWIYSETFTLGSSADTLSLTINIAGADQTAVNITPNQGSYTWQSATFNGSWTQTDLDAMRLKFTRNMLGSGPASGRDDDIGVATAYAEVTYTLPGTTTIGNGTNPGNSTVAPGSSITDLDAFTLVANSGTDSITAATVTLTGANSYESLNEVRITSSDGATLYFTAITNPSSNTLSFSGGGAIPVNTTQTTFKVRITPKTHANMPAPPGTSYAVGGTVTAFTSTNTQAGSDSASATITVDNASPSGATATSGSSGNAQVTLNWTTSSSGDFSRSAVLRWAASTPGTEVPSEGTDYSVDATISTATVACILTADASSSAVSGIDGAGSGGCSAVALTNDQAYSYKVFQKDSNGNYDVGVIFSGSPFTPAAGGSNTVAISTSGTQNSPITIPSTDQYFGGVFVIKRTNGAATSLTNVTVSNIGTTNAEFSLTNVKLIYDIDSVTPYDCASVSKDGDETQFGSTLAGFDALQKASFTGSTTISTTQTFCGYLVADVVAKGTLDIKFDLRTGKRSSGATNVVIGSETNTSLIRTIIISSEGRIFVSE